MHYVITGPSRGVGEALVKRFAGPSIKLSLLGRESESLRAVAKAARERGALVREIPCELAERQQVARAAREAEEAGPVDVLIHNAAVVERGQIADMPDEEWDRVLEVNLSAPFRLTRALLPKMLARGSGRILFVSSISAVLGTRGQAAYNASKAGLVSVMRCLAEELTDTGLTTMALLPGSIDTDMLRGSGFPPRMSPDEVAEVLAFYAHSPGRAHNGAYVEMFGR